MTFLTATPVPPPKMEYGCWDCYDGAPFLDALVVLLLLAPIAIALFWIGYRMITKLLQISDEDRW